MPKNCRRNCPVKTVNPIAIRFGHGIFGRGSQMTAMAATMKRRAVNCGGVKLSNPTLLTTNATPHITATRTANAT
jgi:hypothetical protein